MVDWNSIVLLPGENEADLKRRFAERWAKFPYHPIAEIVLSLLTGNRSDNTGRAYQMAELWKNDVEVLELRDEIARTGGLKGPSDLPGKEQVGAEILSVARSPISADEKVKAYKLYAEVMGYIDKSKPIAAATNGAELLAAIEERLPG